MARVSSPRSSLCTPHRRPQLRGIGRRSTVLDQTWARRGVLSIRTGMSGRSRRRTSSARVGSSNVGRRSPAYDAPSFGDRSRPRFRNQSGRRPSVDAGTGVRTDRPSLVGLSPLVPARQKDVRCRWPGLAVYDGPSGKGVHSSQHRCSRARAPAEARARSAIMHEDGLRLASGA